MKTKEFLKYTCDICSSAIWNMDKSNRFYYSIGWQSGSHSGTHEKEGHVCDNCKGSKFRRWIVNLYLGLKGV